MAKPKKIFLLEAVVIGAGAEAQTLEPGKLHSIDGDVANALIKSGAARLPQSDAGDTTAEAPAPAPSPAPSPAPAPGA